jgi:hypothetical protein
VPAREVPVGHAGDEPAAYARLRRWASELGMPRFVFWRSEPRQKPTYLDFDSPLLVSVFLAAVRKTSEVIVVSEMHPDPDHTWLPDADGRTYTSELRLVFTDPLIDDDLGT